MITFKPGCRLWPLGALLCLLCLLGWDRVLAHGDGAGDPLVVVHSSRTPPLAYVGFNGEKKGLVVEYWRMWSRQNGIPIKIVLAEWAETLRMVRDGRADIHGGLYVTSERRQYLDFAPTYFDLNAAVFVKKGLGIDSMDGLGSREIGVLDKGYSEYYLKKHHPRQPRRSYASASAMAEDAIAGNLDAMLSECPTMTYLLGKYGRLQDFDMLKPLYTRPMHPAVVKGNDELLALVEGGMKRIPSKECERVFSRWTIPNSPSSTWLKVILGFIVLLVGGLVFHMFYRPRKRGPTFRVPPE